MSLITCGTRTRSSGILDALIKYGASINLKAASRVEINFDPFGKNAEGMRVFSFYMNKKKILVTNPNCRVKTNIIIGDPTVNIKLLTGESILMKCQLLTSLDLIKLMNKHVSSKAPQDEDQVPVVTKQTKAGKRK